MDGTLLVAFVALQLAQHLTELWLARLNRQYTLEPRHQEEAARALRISSEDMDRSVAYAEDRYRFGLVASWLSVVPALVFLALGGLGWVEGWSLALAAPVASGNVAVGLVFFAILGLGSAVLGLPFGLYRTFGIEARHGFNRQSLPGFFKDWLKGLALAGVLGGSFLAAVLAIVERGGRHWWVIAWAAVAAFSLLTAWLYPRLLAPIFNKFSPLPDGELKDAILALAEKVGFRARSIHAMDASRRTSHGNAYFTGLFGARRIVLFDTLLETLGTREVVAVLAHELGHFKLKHVRWQLCRGVLLTGAQLYVLSLLLDLEPFYRAFGLPQPTPYGALIVFGLWFGLLEFLLFQPLHTALSRRAELAADRFATGHGVAPEALAEALLALRERSHLMPISHPLYSRVYHSHPPLLERLRALGTA
jgi:STE24 endopeptidase